MYNKSITFKDLDGNDVTEEFQFHLYKNECVEMELSVKGGLSDHLQRVVADNDGGLIIRTFKEILAKSVGRRSEDGRRFEKNETITNAFLQSGAYDVFFFDLVTNADVAAQFINNVVPKDMTDKLVNVELPKKEFTDAELLTMSDDEFNVVVGTDLTKMTQDQVVIAYKRKLARK